jgi:hypothetical protein
MTPLLVDEKTQRVVTEAQRRIQAVYPDAGFRLIQGDDPAGLYLDVYTDAEDSVGVFDVVNDWLVDLSVNEGIVLHVIPLPKAQEMTPYL